MSEFKSKSETKAVLTPAQIDVRVLVLSCIGLIVYREIARISDMSTSKLLLLLLGFLCACAVFIAFLCII